MRQQTLFPAIRFGTAAVTFYTAADSDPGKLIGGNTFSRFSVLALRGVPPPAHMEVAVSRECCQHSRPDSEQLMTLTRRRKTIERIVENVLAVGR